MSTGVVAAIVVAVLVVIAIVAALATMRGGPSTGRLKHRFGPEYDRTLARHEGDVKATRQELSARVERYGGLERKPLSTSERDRYTDQWDAVQAHFVEEPARAVGEADRLIAELAAHRGFPDAGSPEHFDALSVHHAQQVQGYRRAHALAEHAGAGGQGATEDLRQALISARHLFHELVTDGGKAPRGTDTAPPVVTKERTPQVREPMAERPAESDPDRPRAAHDDEAAPEHSWIGNRFAALSGAGRKDHSDGGRT